MQPTWVQRHRLKILLAAALAVAWASWQVLQTRFDFSPQNLFELDDGDPRTRFWQRSIQAFGRGDNLLFVVAEHAEPDGAVSPAARSHLERLASELRGRPFALEVVSADSALLPVSRDDSLELIEGRQLDGAALRAHPLLQGRLVSADGRMNVLILAVADSHRRVEELTAVVEEIEAWLRDHAAPPGLRLGLAGVPFVRVNIVRTLIADQMRYTPVTALVVALALLLVLRSLRRAVPPMIAVVVATLIGVAAGVATGTPVDIVNQMLPVLILIIAFSDALHLVARHGDELAMGKPPAQALAVTVRHLALACLLTSLTTAAGFASLTTMQTPVIRRFGLVASLAIVLAFVVILTLLPALLALLPLGKGAVAPSPGLANLALRVGWVGMRWPRAVLLGVVLLGAGSAALGYARVHADIHLIDYFPEHDDSRQLLERVERQLGGVLGMDVVLEAREGQALLDADLLRRLDTLQARVRTLPGVNSAFGVVDILSALHQAVSGSEVERLPSSREALAQTWLLTELSGRPLPLHGLVGEDGHLLRTTLRLQDIGGRQSLQLAQAIEQIGTEVMAGRPDLIVRVTGDAESVSRHTMIVIRDLFLSLCLAGGAIFLCLLVAFRSLRLALLSVIPNALPLILTSGFMGLIGADLDFGNVVIFSVSLGLAVDDTVHILARYREEAIAPGDNREIIERALLGSGRAVVLTTLVLGSGMLVLMTSSFVPTRMFGLLTLVTLATALVADLLVLPALLTLFPPGRRESENTSADPDVA
ncbi:MAG: MMPL family transporter [Pseudomonadota bacterium]